MPIHVPWVRPFSYYDWLSRDERALIEAEWKARDRAAIKSYGMVLALRARRDARLGKSSFSRSVYTLISFVACSRAVAAIRQAVFNPQDHKLWIEYQAIASTYRENGMRNWAGRPGWDETGPWEAWGDVIPPWRRIHHRPVYPSANQAWANPAPWRQTNPAWGFVGPTEKWDGVPVPKTPGKKRRRKERYRKEVAEYLAARALFHQRTAEAGTGLLPRRKQDS